VRRKIWGVLAGAISFWAAVMAAAGAAQAAELQFQPGAHYTLQCRDNLVIGLANIAKAAVSGYYSADFILIPGDGSELKLPLLIHPADSGDFYIGESQISNDYVAIYPSYDKDYPQRGENVLIIMGSADILPQMRPVAACIVKDPE